MEWFVEQIAFFVYRHDFQAILESFPNYPLLGTAWRIGLEEEHTVGLRSLFTDWLRHRQRVILDIEQRSSQLDRRTARHDPFIHLHFEDTGIDVLQISHVTPQT